MSMKKLQKISEPLFAESQIQKLAMKHVIGGLTFKECSSATCSNGSGDTYYETSDDNNKVLSSWTSKPSGKCVQC